MPILIGLVAIIAPRITIVVLALFTPVMERAFDGLLVPLLGFLFLPVTTLAYAAAVNFAGGVQGTLWIAIMVIAVLIDLGGVGWHARSRRRAA